MQKTVESRGQRVAKYLARRGVASRRTVEKMILDGRVEVNGQLLSTPAFLVSPHDNIRVDGKPVSAMEPTRLWRFHKPRGTVTTAADEKGRTTVFDLLPEGLPRVMSIGRLDLNSEGLLLLTNDGELKRRLELPATGWIRRYRVRVHGRLDDTAMERLRTGLVLGNERLRPIQVAIDREQGTNSWLTVKLREGKNREVRRAFEAVGTTVNRLIRISFGPFRLDGLKPGEVTEVSTRNLRATVPGRIKARNTD